MDMWPLFSVLQHHSIGAQKKLQLGIEVEGFQGADPQFLF
jgi:hypothetical protein